MPSSLPQPHPRPAPAADARSLFHTDMLAALDSPCRSISPKYFYDAEGSALFDAICALPEYYPTRTELAILQGCAGDVATLAGRGTELIEFGAGSLQKVRLLLDALEEPARYVPVDISGEHLETAALRLRRDYPGLEVRPLVGDYTHPLLLPAPHPGGGKRLGFFPGSTLGNFDPPDALHFLRRAARMLRGGALLLGVDLIKDPAVLHAAYNDSARTTAAFNLNLLARANRELGTDFELQGFAHGAFYNSPARRIEMHLVSRQRQSVQLGDRSFVFEHGQTLHTENSYKYSVEGLQALAAEAGFSAGPVWTDPAQLFSVHWLAAPPG
jgi:dimethylhistidine N-methyltransferase